MKELKVQMTSQALNTGYRIKSIRMKYNGSPTKNFIKTIYWKTSLKNFAKEWKISSKWRQKTRKKSDIYE